jgi:NTE family protein
MYDTVVLPAGALKGIALLGALQCLVDRGLLSSVDKYIGTSVGSIIAYLLCIGYTPIEIMVRICQTDPLTRMAQFDVFGAVSGVGAVSYSVINDLVEKMTIEKIGRLLTLGALQKEFGKTLVCGTYNYTRRRHEFLDASTRCDMPCLTAIRMSSNVPFLFEPFRYEDDYFLDGGLYVGFPLFRVEKTDHVLGICFKENDDPACIHVSTHNFLNYVYNMLVIPSRHLEMVFNEGLVEDADLIRIDLKLFQSFNFHISKNVQLEIFSIGYETARGFTDKKITTTVSDDGGCQTRTGTRRDDG